MRGNFFLHCRSEHRIAFVRFGRPILQSSQLPERCDIPPVVARLVNRRFGNEGAARQSFRSRSAEAWMPQNPRKCLRTNLPFADVVVPVHAATERDLRVIGVKDRDVFHADGAFNLANRGSQPSFRLDVVSGSEKVRRV